MLEGTTSEPADSTAKERIAGAAGGCAAANPASDSTSRAVSMSDARDPLVPTLKPSLPILLASHLSLAGQSDAHGPAKAATGAGIPAKLCAGLCQLALPL